LVREADDGERHDGLGISVWRAQCRHIRPKRTVNSLIAAQSRSDFGTFPAIFGALGVLATSGGLVPAFEPRASSKSGLGGRSRYATDPLALTRATQVQRRVLSTEKTALTSNFRVTIAETGQPDRFAELHHQRF
jgi:hypothetical protein